MNIGIIGAGAFGTGLANALATQNPISLWGRDAQLIETMQSERENARRLPGVVLHPNVTCTHSLVHGLQADVLLLCLPTQQLAAFVQNNANKLAGKILIACCKGVDLATGKGPVDVIHSILPTASAGILTGPSFAIDIAKGLPTALTLAMDDSDLVLEVQRALSTSNLRLYTTDDVQGAQLGGALKNVIAIGCGAIMGAGLGDSARAALITRGFAETQRFADAMGARPETLSGLSGFGDMTLTCTCDKSRNYRFGYAMGAGTEWTSTETVEGRSTAYAVKAIAASKNIDMPIAQTLCALMDGDITLQQATVALLSRPLTQE
ncbi:NAD(P)H-dependent glycerol-3-phosphate dehydrogenase [Algirhabdus cladophorae]|uniref:NAD(P)H-dependent glycerol-3-phosphate dehydrogenase n=1 Tax=Algirhabdus cladophorae TaxID=3377108 RepID=UPI003B848283